MSQHRTRVRLFICKDCNRFISFTVQEYWKELVLFGQSWKSPIRLFCISQHNKDHLTATKYGEALPRLGAYAVRMSKKLLK